MLASYVVKRWRMYVLAWGVSAIGVVIQTTLPFLVRALLDDALPAREIGLVVGLVLAIGGAYGIHRLTVIGNRIGRERGLVRMDQDLRTDLFARLIRRDGHFFDRQTSGDLTDRLMRDTHQASHWSQHLVMKGFPRDLGTGRPPDCRLRLELAYGPGDGGAGAGAVGDPALHHAA